MPIENQAVHVIACGVLAVDLKHVARELDLDVKLHFMPGGLHASPHTLRERLQEAIDEIPEHGATRIVLGYGVCGRGTVGLQARGIPLVIPRVHDCIALFLGSDARYAEEFARHPGTFYLSAGWVEEKGTPGTRRRMGSRGSDDDFDFDFQYLMDEYGESNAAYIRDFMSSWKRNYTRSAFIDSGVSGRKEHYAGLAEAMARDCGWQYERLTGTHDLLEKILTASETTDDLLVVPPGATTQYDAIRRRLAVAPTAAGATSRADLASPAPPQNRDEATDSRSGIGLGIDAGGTYTDVVLYNLTEDTFMAKAKALTTRWNYALGISEALDQLDADTLARVRMVAVSTTLATNAIVEGQGQKTGLLVMTPCGWQDTSRFKHKPLAIVKGQLGIDGTQNEPVDPDQVRRIARSMVEVEGVTAFAVGGYASHANPSHELAVKAAIEQETGCHVTCSYELSEGLSYRIRSETAALNARIIPCLRTFLDRLCPALSDHGVQAPVMVVRSDGTLMSLQTALERPVETMLSGPAASVAGASWLARRQDAVVVDVGGTTTDTAVLRHGAVDMCEDGATIGGWQTHVRALNLRTLGLGGDSLIRFEKGIFTMGPRRVAPVSWLGAQAAGCGETLAWLEAHLDAFDSSTRDTLIYSATGADATGGLDDEACRLLNLLRERPRSLHEAAALLGKPDPRFLQLQRLETLHLVQACGLTPTDLLHARGELDLWDRSVAQRLCRLYAALSHRTEADLTAQLMRQFERKLAAEMFKKSVAEDIDPEHINAQPAALALIDRALQATGDDYSVRLRLEHPVVGIGAPASCFVPRAAKLLHAEAVIPEHADVANAVGAITGAVSLCRHVTISVNELGQYRVGGVPDAPAFDSIADATAFGADYLKKTLIEYALRAGAADPQVEVVTDDSVAPSSDGNAIFIGRTLEGRVTSQPRPVSWPRRG